MTTQTNDDATWQDYFDPDETLIWEGSPMATWPGIGALGLAAFGVPFLGAGLLVMSMAIFGLGDSSDAGAWGPVVRFGIFCFGIPFATMGGGMVFGPTYLARMAPYKVRYALTSKRAYIATSWWKKSMDVLNIAPGAPVRLDDNRSVFFSYTLSTDSDGDRNLQTRGFENIADARKVYQMIRQLQDRS